MDTKEILSFLPGLLGGVAVFLFGMNMLSEGLQKIAGDKLRHIISILTNNPIIGILVGTVVTAIIQSSSATTVMVIGFVSAGLMTLKQSIGVIIGANIGTTVTAWLVSIDIGELALPLTGIGFILYFFMKSKKLKYIGQIIFSFGLLFVGLNIMSDMMAPLAKSQAVADTMLKVSNNRFLVLFIGTIFTAIIQSSSAAIAIMQKLAVQTTAAGEPLITLRAALPILFGSNIGTTATALLASIGASVNAKRAAFTHTVFNVVGSLIFIWFIGPYEHVISLIMGGTILPHEMDTAIAYSHSMFNIVNAILFTPFIGLLAKFVTRLYKGKGELSDRALVYISDKVSSPAVALNLAMQEMLRMGKIVQKMITSTKIVILEQKELVIQEINEMEDTVDMLQNEILNYLSKIISQNVLSEAESVRLTGYMRMVHDLERIGDHCESSAMLGQSNIENKVQYSDSALFELKEVFEKIELIMSQTLVALENNDKELAKYVLSEENNMDDIEKTLRERHLERLKNGECNPSTAITYVELIHTMERMTDNCKNIAESVIDDLNHRLIGHYDKAGKAIDYKIIRH
ncbi:MAG: Na/Pi cotransporter family protein [Clostridiaceae bacterium]|nr:Na/Pi cotransporter family protein [Clostridiaceae bacterium]